ncbi:hypothetical protein GCM10009624_14110 [Gordonia sinesedis]
MSDNRANPRGDGGQGMSGDPSQPARNAEATSPYDEPTGQIPVPEQSGQSGQTRPTGDRPPSPGRRRPPSGADRDSFYDRHARAPMSRVDDLDDLDPGEVETRQFAAQPTDTPGGTPHARAASTPRGPRRPVPMDDPSPETGRFPESGGRAPTETRPPAETRPETRPLAASTDPGVADPSERGDRDSQPDPDDTPTTASPVASSTANDAQPTAVYDASPDATARDTTVRESDAYDTAAPDARAGTATTAMAAAGTDDDRFHDTRSTVDRDDDRREAARSAAADDLADAERRARRGTLDLGLLLLRVGVGAIMVAHGLQKLFGWWNGPGLDGFEGMLVNQSNTAIGFQSDWAQPLAILGALSETIGGAMLVLGLLTPIAASAILGVMLVAAAYKTTLAGGFSFFATAGGIEFELLLALAAAVIILTGPGLYSLDNPRGWARRPFLGSAAWLIIGVAAAVAVWILTNGTNPLSSPGNPG